MQTAVPPIPRLVAPAAALTCAAVALSALGGAVAALLLGKIVPGAKPAWTMFGFELITLVTAATGLLFASGRYRHAPGMALACIGGTVFSAAVCTHIGVHGALGPHSIKLLTLGRVLAAFLLAGLGGACVLARNPASWRVFVKGAVLALPTLVAAGLVVATRGEIFERLNALGHAGKAIVLGLSAIIAGGTLCASVEFLVRAFRMGEAPSAPTNS